MFFLNQLSKKGKWIYFITVMIAVSTLVYLSVIWPGGQYIAKFFIFAGIWFIGLQAANQFKKEE